MPDVEKLPPLDEDDPEVREVFNIRVEIYDEFSLAEWVEIPGKCGTGATPAEAIEEMIDFIRHDYEFTKALPDDKCAPDLIAARPWLEKFVKGLPKENA